ncbi:MAG: carotenoid biosynthesis protein, partial [Caldilineaceae bacterium]
RLTEPLLPYLFVALWALAMISVPILGWTLGPAAMRYGVIAGVLLQAAASVSALWTSWGAAPTVRVVALVLPAAWLVEFVGSHTGVPFGAYHYTPLLQPQVGGVPLLIPLAWLMMLPAAWAVSEILVGRGQGKAGLLRFVGLAAVAFTVWDLFLDPQMVRWEYWEWDNPGGYFGIPWVNYGGWLLCSFLIGLLVFTVGPTLPPMPKRPLLVIYTVTWALQSVGLAVFWRMPGPAFVGFVAMGAFVVMAWRASLSRGHLTPQSAHP